MARKLNKTTFDPNSQAAQVARDVIQPDQPSANAKVVTPKIASIDIAPSDNGGFTVSHRKKPAGGKHGADEWSDSMRETHVFPDHKSAHEHIGRLMGGGGGLK